MNLRGVSSLTSFLWLFCKRARGPAWPSGVHVSVRRVCSLCVLEQCDAAKTALRPEPREGERVALPLVSRLCRGPGVRGPRSAKAGASGPAPVRRDSARTYRCAMILFVLFAGPGAIRAD